MTKKFFKEKLKSQKGISAADTLISLLIILTSISIIGMVYLNINVITRSTNAKAGATRIATNIIENIKGTYYINVQNINEVGNGQSVYNTKIPKGYTVAVTTESVSNDDTNLAQKVTVEVNYNKNDNSDKVVLSTILEREIIRECNSPNFSDEYIEELVGEGNDYQFYQGLNLIESGKKIICPIKFNGENYYLLQPNELNDLWYSYSDKQWARVLVFNDLADLQQYVDTDNSTIVDKSILKDNDKSFVWIPRFKIDETVSPNKLYFMYKDTDYVIKKSEDNNIYDYIYVSDDELYNNLTVYFTENAGVNPVVGSWFNYYYINNLDLNGNIVKKLYDSNYGPLFEF